MRNVRLLIIKPVLIEFFVVTCHEHHYKVVFVTGDGKKIHDKALSTLFTVCDSQIWRDRFIIGSICRDKQFAEFDKIVDRSTKNRYHVGNPMNRLP